MVMATILPVRGDDSKDHCVQLRDARRLGLRVGVSATLPAVSVCTFPCVFTKTVLGFGPFHVQESRIVM